MSTLFHFRFHPNEDARASALVIFCPQEDIVEQNLWDVINEDVGENLTPDLVYFVVRADFFSKVCDQIQTIASTPSQWRIDPNFTPMGIIAFDKQGQYANSAQLLGLPLELSKTRFDAIKQQGVLTIFLRRNGLIHPGKSVHYIHPSGRHSRGFLRTANVLIHGPEVNFLAMCLLHHLDECRHYLWIDTSSIASVPYAMITLRQGMDPDFKVPTVNSFSSYEGLEATKFERKDGSVVLISASTSGSLARRMIKEGFAAAQVVTLFSLASDSTGLTILCDLADESAINPSGDFSATEDFNATNCPMCQEGSKPVRFVGDQFLADAISYEPYTILASDAPQGLSRMMDKYSGKDVFQVKAARTSDDSANEIWIDVAGLCATDEFCATIKKLAERYVPLSTSLIVHLNDRGCLLLANIIHERLATLAQQTPKIVKVKDLPEVQLLDNTGGVVIVSSCIGSGAELQSVSRDLRDLFEERPRIYLSSFAKFSQTTRYGSLKSDLGYNGQGFKHEVAVLNPLVLPKLPNVSSWTRERNFLQSWIDIIESEDSTESEQTLNKLKERVETLSGLAAGCAAGLFWPSLTGKDLALCQTFAFWPTFQYEDRTISQGDVFVTIASVLENLRTGDKPKMLHTSFYHTLLSPACFGRFNDGVIQASLLRTALPQELNYGATTNVSEDMANLVTNVMRNWDKTRGEACLEFLIALATKRMTLAPEHLRAVLTVPKGVPLLLKDFIEHCQSLLLPD